MAQPPERDGRKEAEDSVCHVKNETQICNPNEQTGKILQLHEGPCDGLQVHRCVANGEGSDQVGTTEMETQTPYQTQVGSQRILHGNLLEPLR